MGSDLVVIKTEFEGRPAILPRTAVLQFRGNEVFAILEGSRFHQWRVNQGPLRDSNEPRTKEGQGDDATFPRTIRV